MNKKLVAALVAGAFAAPIAAQADTNTVTLYGIAQVAASYWDVDAVNGVGGVAKQGLEDTGSRIGFKGEEQLGGGMKAFFQMESGVSLDQGGGTFASREGWVGLKGNFGGVQLGRGKTVFDLAQEAFDPFNANSTLINTGLVDGVYYRANNVIRYTMPEIAGLSGAIEYGDMEGKGTNPSGNGVKPQLIDASLRYENGPLFVQGGYEYQKDTRDATAVSDTTTATAVPHKSNAVLIGAGYTLPFGTALAGAYRHVEVKDSGNKEKRDQFLVNATQPFGNVNVKLGYVHAGNAKGCPDTGCTLLPADKGADYYIGAVEYNFSKRTWVYLEHATADNKDNSGLFRTAAVDNLGNTTYNNGDNRTTSLGIIHLF
ncbi:porin [Chitinivorax sp. PXF-14]|uniref:porin n=1 Tax=Chitinivorax sp. PXF-14 TaxID=3230488 RepID=UPI0034678784